MGQRAGTHALYAGAQLTDGHWSTIKRDPLAPLSVLPIQIKNFFPRAGVI